MGSSRCEFRVLHAARRYAVRGWDHTSGPAGEIQGGRVQDSVDRSLTVGASLCWRFVQHLFTFASIHFRVLQTEKSVFDQKIVPVSDQVKVKVESVNSSMLKI